MAKAHGAAAKRAISRMLGRTWIIRHGPVQMWYRRGVEGPVLANVSLSASRQEEPLVEFWAS
jgi:hypothetical protein